jgi:hypothetical protein
MENDQTPTKDDLREKQRTLRIQNALEEYVVVSEMREGSRMSQLGVTILDSPRKPPPERHNPTQVPIEEHQTRCILNAIRRLTEFGMVGKARDQLTADPLFHVTAHNVETVYKLFTKRKADLEIPHDVHTNTAYDFDVDPEIVRDVLERKKTNTGKGPSNLGFESLKPLLDHQEAFKGLCRVVSDILNDRVPHHSELSRRLRSFKGLLFQKKGPTQARPIGVPEAIKNLASAVQARQATPSVVTKLHPESYGVGVRDGCAVLALKFQTLISNAKANNDPFYMFLIDIENMYGNLSRSLILNILVQEHPILVRGFLATYQGAGTVSFPEMEPTFRSRKALLKETLCLPCTPRS